MVIITRISRLISSYKLLSICYYTKSYPPHLTMATAKLATARDVVARLRAQAPERAAAQEVEVEHLRRGATPVMTPYALASYGTTGALQPYRRGTAADRHAVTDLPPGVTALPPDVAAVRLAVPHPHVAPMTVMPPSARAIASAVEACRGESMALITHLAPNPAATAPASTSVRHGGRGGGCQSNHQLLLPQLPYP